MSDDLPFFSEEDHEIIIESNSGIVGLDLNLCALIVADKPLGKKGGTCGSCGNQTRIKEYNLKSLDKGYGFIYLCQNCDSIYRSKFNDILEVHAEDILAEII